MRKTVIGLSVVASVLCFLAVNVMDVSTLR